MSRCTHRVSLLHYCTPSSIGLALDVCVAIKRLFLTKFIIRLVALLTEQFTSKYCIFFPPSFPDWLEAFLLLPAVIQIKCG